MNKSIKAFTLTEPNQVVSTVNNDQPIHWSFVKRLLFRLLFIAFAIYAMNPGYYPFIELLANENYSSLYYNAVIWLQNNVLHNRVAPPRSPTGSGDTIDDYVILASIVVIALVGSMLWSVLDRKRPHYMRLSQWLRVGLRYYLGVQLLSYGSAKIFASQMPYPTLLQLNTVVGDLSPMRLAWIYLGASPLYQSFTGWAEMIAGILLVIRPTALLGACLAVGVMLNVFLINVGYDIVVKLFSFVLLLTACGVVFFDIPRLWDMFISHSSSPRAASQFVIQKPWERYLRYVAKIIIVIHIGFLLYIDFEYRIPDKEARDKSSQSPLYGIFNVIDYRLNDSTITLNPKDTTRWREVIVSEARFDIREGMYGAIKRGVHIQDRINLRTNDSIPHYVEIRIGRGEAAKKWKGQYQIQDSTHLVLDVYHHTDSLHVVLERTFKERKFILVNEPFHWTAEQAR
jgi:uncharacterized membrane protein YphA (DoxX/SURF4 family)